MSPETALDVDPVWLRRFINRHGGAQTYTDNDMTPLTLFILSSCILIALTPPTRGWKIVRASLLPLLVIYQAHFSIFTLAPKWETQWGNITGQLWHLEKALEVMWFYPGEEHCYRVRRRADMVQDKGDKAMKGEEKGDELLPETIPPPRTLAKLYWSLNLWFSERGIGWNYAAPLPDSSRRHPFTRTSGRIPFLFNRGMYLTIVYLVSDLARSYMAFGPGAAFFTGLIGIAPSYNSLSISQRALYSLPVAARVLWSIEEWYTPISLIAVSIGGILGWEGEWWSPWGWPPLFGTMRDLWVHPGLSHMWSKTWHQYFHHWLYLFGWLGIGETIIGLPQSGISARPRPPPSSLAPITSAPSSEESSTTSTRSASPAHPLPTTPSNRSSFKMMAANFLKSLIVFFLTGLHHDIPSYLTLLHTSPAGQPIPMSHAFATMPFFVLQPFALAVEAYVKKYWRGWKDRVHPEWKKGNEEPKWLVHLERTVGFVWTWWWLGHTARYFVVGLTRTGLYRYKEGQPAKFSPVGGVIYGRWSH